MVAGAALVQDAWRPEHARDFADFRITGQILAGACVAFYIWPLKLGEVQMPSQLILLKLMVRHRHLSSEMGGCGGTALSKISFRTGDASIA
jgi:hypothetical protein